MPLKVNNAKRSFIIKNNNKEVVLKDPNPNMDPVDVMRFYSGQYPELTSSNVSGPKIKDGSAVYTFQTIIGDKG